MYIRKSNFFYKQKKLDKLIKLAKTEKYSSTQLVKIFQCNKKTIYRALKHNNLLLPNLGKFKRKYNLKDNFFNKLNPTSAYWLGFIAADGCISKRDSSLAIGLNSVDKCHLEKFLRALGCNGQIHKYDKTNSVKVSIYSKPITDCLTSYGITPNKSLTIERVDVPTHLASHFIRGIYDGDGSLTGTKRTHVQFMIAGNKPFLEYIQGILIKQCNLNCVKIYPLQSKVYKLQYTGIQIFRILDYLYKDSNSCIRLDRKFATYLYYKNKYY